MRVADLKPRITLTITKQTPQQIIKQVADNYCLTTDEILGTSRKQYIAWARQDAFDRLYRETTLSLPGIGRLFKKHHSTVLYGIWEHRKRVVEGK